MQPVRLIILENFSAAVSKGRIQEACVQQSWDDVFSEFDLTLAETGCGDTHATMKTGKHFLHSVTESSAVPCVHILSVYRKADNFLSTRHPQSARSQRYTVISCWLKSLACSLHSFANLRLVIQVRRSKHLSVNLPVMDCQCDPSFRLEYWSDMLCEGVAPGCQSGCCSSAVLVLATSEAFAMSVLPLGKFELHCRIVIRGMNIFSTV